MFGPLAPFAWRDDAIGVFSGVVSEDGAGIVPYAGPSPLIVEDPSALPPAGTEVTFTVFSPRSRGRDAFYARNVRAAA